VETLLNNSIPVDPIGVSSFIAYLYNRQIIVWSHDVSPHVVTTHNPDDFQIPETHPKYAEIQKMRHPPGAPINIWDKQQISSIGHCWALLPK
jgi:hypothetical protein